MSASKKSSTWTVADEVLEDCGSGSEAESDASFQPSDASGTSCTEVDERDNEALAAALARYVSHAAPKTDLTAEFKVLHRGAPADDFVYHQTNDKYYIVQDTATGHRYRAVHVTDPDDFIGGLFHVIDTVNDDRKACQGLVKGFSTNKRAAEWELGEAGLAPKSSVDFTPKDAKVFKSNKLQFAYSTVHALDVIKKLKHQSAAKKIKRSKNTADAQPPAKKARVDAKPAPATKAVADAVLLTPASTPVASPAAKKTTRTMAGTLHLPTLGLTLNNVVFTLNK